MSLEAKLTFLITGAPLYSSYELQYIYIYQEVYSSAVYTHTSTAKYTYTAKYNATTSTTAVTAGLRIKKPGPGWIFYVRMGALYTNFSKTIVELLSFL